MAQIGIVRHNLMQTPPPLPGARPAGWMNRNWKWLVPLFCLLVLTGIGGFFAVLVTLMKSSDAYSGAVARASSNPAVIEALGTPIKDGLFFTGNISENNSSGSANLVIPISGPKRTASLYVSATRSLGKWHFDGLVVEVDGTKQRIDILDTNQLPVATPDSSIRPAEKQ